MFCWLAPTHRSPDVSRRGCNDWHSTRQALFGRGAQELVPVPAEVMTSGLSAFERSGGLTRRNVLAGGVGLFLAASGMGGLSSKRLLEAAAAQAAEDPNGKILVLIHQDGGNDGLNTLVPLADPRYRELRSRIGIAPATTLALPGVTDFGWHPALTGLKELYDAGKVAVLPSVDFANPDQSHFNSAGYWRSGIVGKAPDRTGWLGRTMDLIGTPENALQAVSVTYSLDPVLLSKRAAVGTVYDPSDFGFWIPDVWSEDAFLPLYRQISQGARGSGHVAAQAAYRNAITMRDRLRPLHVDDEHPAAPTPREYPDSSLGKGLKNLSRMLAAGLGTRVATVSSGGGYDTHDDQPGKHADLLKDLGDSLAAWQADLDSKGLADRVITMVWSEFGRRAEDNESMGTDHGAGGLVLVVGNKAKGGIQSEFPGLGRLDEDGNLLVSTEFRTVYASLLESWMGVEAAKILPGIDARRLPLIA